MCEQKGLTGAVIFGCPFLGSKNLAASVPATRAAATLNTLRLLANTLAHTCKAGVRGHTGVGSMLAGARGCV